MPKSNNNSDNLSEISEQIRKMYGDDIHKDETPEEQFDRHRKIMETWLDKHEKHMVGMSEPPIGDVYIRNNSKASEPIVPGPGFLAVLNKDVIKVNPDE